MDRQAQLEAMMRQYMASQQNRGAVSDAEMQMMAPQQGMGQMTDADMAIRPEPAVQPGRAAAAS
jgi:hypothetical protein